LQLRHLSAIPGRVGRPPAGARTDGRVSVWLLCGVLSAMVLVLLAMRAEHWRADARQERLVTAQVIELDRQLGQLAIVPRLLADDLRAISALTLPSPGTLDAANRMLERARTRSGADVVYLLDPTGVTVASSNWREASSFVGANYGFRPYVRGALAGIESTFFAVGATTGEPGYFVARPVHRSRPTGAGSGPAPTLGTTVGVVAAKLSLDAHVESWRAQPHLSLVTDEFGVVILSSDASLLYIATAPLDADARATIAADRRYEPLERGSILLPIEGRGAGRLLGADQRVVSRPLRGESWRLHLLVPASGVRLRAALLGAAMAGLAAIALLLLWTFHQARRLAETEQRTARELERLVAVRTAELETAQRALIAESNFAMLGRMSAAINHEINQPLASLRFDLATLRHLVATERPPLAEVREAIIDTDRTTRRIARVVETLRSLARQGASELQTLDVARLIKEAERAVRHERPDATRALEVALPHGPGPYVAGNAVLLQQAVLNLLHNALDATLGQESPHVHLALTRRSGASIVITVDDDGPGVDPALRERLFEPFATGGSPSTGGTGQRAGGLGLGLTLARQIADDHGGTLACVDRPEGGSRFVLTLPELPA